MMAQLERGFGKDVRGDEIDKSDIDLPNDLLNIFEEAHLGKKVFSTGGTAYYRFYRAQQTW